MEVFEIVDINKLKPLERVLKHHLTLIEREIIADGYIRRPIIVDKNSGTILDGSHRYVFLIKNGFHFAPVLWVDYMSDDVTLKTGLDRLFDVNSDLSKEDCINRSRTGHLLEPRTTRHFFKFKKRDYICYLNELKELTDDVESTFVQNLIKEQSIQDEILIHEKYIDEISKLEDLLFLNFLELNEAKMYLKKTIDKLEKLKPIALFPGKFNPPHMGHLVTILEHQKNYSKFIILITNDVPEDSLIKPKEISLLFKEIFKNSSSVEVMVFNKKMTTMHSLDGLPNFDVILSGNPEIIEWGKSKGVNTKFVNRSGDERLSASVIRSYYRKSK
jgi:nicotinamide mononucleotide adenylyltransferase